MRIFRRFLKFFGRALLAIVGIALILLAGGYFVGNYRLRTRLAELRAAGEPVTLADLTSDPIPPEANAATFLRRAGGDISEFGDIIVAAYESPEVEKLRERATCEDEVDRSPPMLEAYRRALDAYPQIWPLLEQAAACPDYDPELRFDADENATWVIMPLLQDERSAARVLRWRVLLLLSEGKREEALDTCLAMLRLAKHFDRTPGLVGLLVANAVRSVAVDTTNLVLRSGPLPQPSYDELQGELARHDLQQAFQRALVTERAFGLQMWDEMPFRTGYVAFLTGTNFQLCYLELLDAALEDASFPYWDDSGHLADAHDRHGMLGDLMAPTFEAMPAAVARAEAKLQSLRVLVAILARQHAGQTGKPGLADLGLPAEATTDPFDGQPLHVRKTANGWLIYSVGADLKDDGGQIDKYRTDVGLAPMPRFVNAAQPANSE